MAKKRMRYKPEVKAKIIDAATAVRAAGKYWKDAHAAAQAVGYKGNVDALMQMMAKKKRAISVAPGAKKRGRPAKVQAPAVPALDPVAAQYLVGAIDKAIGELQTLRKQYA